MTGGRLCRAVVAIFALLYLLALALFVIGTFGLFGTEPGPLAGVFVLPLGLPWTVLMDGLPETFLPWAALAAPAINLLILAGLCRMTGRRA